MIDYDNLRRTVIKGLKEYLGCPVILSNQNQEPPAYPYVCYTITTLMSENNGTYGEHEDGKARKHVDSVWSFTAQSDKDIESLTIATKAKEWLDYAGTIYLNDNGVIVIKVTPVTNRDNFLTAEYEYRKGFDCFFNCVDEVDSASEAIDSISLEGGDTT